MGFPFSWIAVGLAGLLRLGWHRNARESKAYSALIISSNDSSRRRTILGKVEFSLFFAREGEGDNTPGSTTNLVVVIRQSHKFCIFTTQRNYALPALSGCDSGNGSLCNGCDGLSSPRVGYLGLGFDDELTGGLEGFGFGPFGSGFRFNWFLE